MRKSQRSYGMISCFGIIFLFLGTFIFFVNFALGASQKNQKQYSFLNRDINRGIVLLYNWEFEKAESLFNKVTGDMPDNPIGYFYLAMVTWSKLASGFWTPEMVKQYGARIDRTIEVARERIEMNEADSFTYFYLGGALGFKGRFQLMERKWLSSFLLALDAIEALKTCRRMDPDNKDVLFGLGIFDYYTARLSGVLRFLSYLLLHKGDKAEGLRKLNIAANEARYSNIEAKSLLIHIYLFLENQLEKTLVLAKELGNDFKQSRRYKFFEGVAYIRLGRDTDYRKIVRYFKERSEHERSISKAAFWGNQADYLEATYQLYQNQFDEARIKLKSLISQADPASDPYMIAWPLVKIGMSYDIEGERQKAVAYYNQVLEMENGAGAQFLARKYLDTAAKKGDPFLAY